MLLKTKGSGTENRTPSRTDPSATLLPVELDHCAFRGSCVNVSPVTDATPVAPDTPSLTQNSATEPEEDDQCSSKEKE